MPEQSVIVWDLETIPDLVAAARMFDMETAAEADVRQAIGSSFPKHPLHKIVSIGAWWRAVSVMAGRWMRLAHPI
jgi:predicted PolB exonuclease-like 3'-5' exonuclease